MPLFPGKQRQAVYAQGLDGIVTGTAAGPGRRVVRGMQAISCARHHVPPEVIRHAVRLYVGFTLGDREEILAERRGRPARLAGLDGANAGPRPLRAPPHRIRRDRQGCRSL